MNPKVSIIIPIYNTEKYLRQCVDAVLRQTLQDIEVILVDDASPDNCPRICDEYARKDSRVKVIHKPNEGQGFARNSGLKLASGDFVAFLDSDDFVDADTCRFLYEKADSANYDAVFYKFVNFREGQNPSSSFAETDEVFTREKLPALALDMMASKPEEKPDRRIECSACTAFYRRSVIVDNHLAFHSERELVSEDMIFNIDFLSHAENAAFNPSVMYFYRMNPNSTSHALRFDKFEKFKKMYDFILANYSKLPEIKERADRLMIGYTRNYLLDILSSSTSFAEKKRLFRQISADSIWSKLAEEYPYRQLPALYRLCFALILKKRFYPLYLLANFKKLCK